MAFSGVYTITPNPTLDLSGVVEDIHPDEKNYIERECRYPGGNGVNAARILRRLGVAVRAGGFLGGAIGAQVLELLAGEGVETDFVAVEGETRVNVTVSNRRSLRQTRFSFPGPKLRPFEVLELLKHLAQKDASQLFILGGSFPPGFRVSHAKRLLREAHARKVACIVDVPADALKSLLASRPLMIKPNLAELEQFVGKKLSGVPAVVREARKLLRLCPAVCVSSVEKGVVLTTREQSFYAVGPKVAAKGSVGAGDSMVGGMAAAIVNAKLGYEDFFGPRAGQIAPELWEQVLCKGLGAAVATVAQSGTQLGTKADAFRYAENVKVKALNF